MTIQNAIRYGMSSAVDTVDELNARVRALTVIVWVLAVCLLGFDIVMALVMIGLMGKLGQQTW